MIAFPASLGAPLIKFTETGLDTRVSDANDMGIADYRAVMTGKVRRFSMPFLLSDDQKAALETFYYTTLGQVQPFVWTHPKTAESIQCVFLSPPGPYEYIGGNWRVTLEVQEA